MMNKVKFDTVKLELAKSATDKLLCAGWKPNGEFELPYPIFKEDIELLKVCADRMTGKAPITCDTSHWACPTCGYPIQKTLYNDESYDFYCEHCGQHIIK